MVLVNCEECNKEISDSAEFCPHCGYKESAETDGFKWRHFISDQLILWSSAAVIVFFLLWLWSRYLNGSWFPK